MNNFSKERTKILEIIEEFGPIRPSQLRGVAGVSTKTVYRHLSALLEEGLIKKAGSVPQVFYSLVSPVQIIAPNAFDPDDYVIDQNYIYVSASGELTRGIRGFAIWCQKNGFDFKREKKIYADQFKSLQRSRSQGLFSGKGSVLSGQGAPYLDNLFFADFYTFGHYGKTKLGQLVYLGKSGQDKTIIGEIADIVRPSISSLIDKYGIKMVCFIPPTIPRQVQFMKVLKQKLGLPLPELKAVKIAGARVAQKTLKRLEDRIENARDTIIVNPDQQIIGNVLIVDDATGSGATLNETARKIKRMGPDKVRVFGFSVVGSYKGFDIISEV